MIYTLLEIVWSSSCEAFAFMSPDNTQQKQQLCHPLSNKRLAVVVSNENSDNDSNSNNGRRLQRPKIRIPKRPRIIRARKELMTTIESNNIETENEEVTSTTTTTMRNRQEQQQGGLGKRIRSSLKERKQNRRRRRQLLNDSNNDGPTYPRPLNNSNSMDDDANTNVNNSESLFIRRNGQSLVNNNNNNNKWGPIRIVRFATRRRRQPQKSSPRGEVPMDENNGDILKLSSDEQYDGLSNEYMTQPITSFSWRSFQETPTAGKRRQWMIRPLEKSELQSNKNNAFEEERFFCLAVPLMPLLGIDLTPIIDLEVIPATKNNNNFFSMDNQMNKLKNS